MNFWLKTWGREHVTAKKPPKSRKWLVLKIGWAYVAKCSLLIKFKLESQALPGELMFFLDFH
jgi:hypothetical protein